MQKLTIGRLAEASGVHLETIRYYERIGLIRKPERTPGGHRSYTTADLDRLRFIRCSRELGFGIEAIRDLLKLSEAGGGACQDVRALAQAHVAAIESRVEQLLRVKETLMRVMDACPADPSPTDTCPILGYMSTCGIECCDHTRPGSPQQGCEDVSCCGPRT